METEKKNLDTILCEAVEISSDEERQAYLDRVCGDDTTLRSEAERLISDHFEAGDFLEKPAVVPDPTLDQPITEKPGTQIGPYKLLQQIGEGGMGVVYMAEQKEPVKRRVALKIIKPGMDTRQVIARFEAERQALAMMDHPNIAKVLDAGQTESGRPYFVMELVNGLPVTQYCDEQHLTPKERLELFVPICQAVQHAHQKGIIHRDLKPSNILVAMYDNKAVPKIIDFGVAKATSQTLTDKTMFTQLGQVVGTLEYMSPEQAQRNQLDIDTRSDIYSLGVVLYELLTGETPFDRARLRSAAFDEILRIIREEEPSKPSTKVSSSLSLPSIAANRRIEPAKLGSMIRGELDWIVLKAMEKDRGRRYETASKFAEDVQHYLNDEAVVACPPSRAYRFRKFARRNKQTILVTGAAIFLMTSIAGVFGWTSYKKAILKEQTTARVDTILDHISKLKNEQRWTAALTEAERGEAIVSTAQSDVAIHGRLEEEINVLRLMQRLDETRHLKKRTSQDQRYTEIFRELGFSPASDENSNKLFYERIEDVQSAIATSLMHWAFVRRSLDENGDPKLWRNLLQIAESIAPEPWRVELCNAYKQSNQLDVLELRDLYSSSRWKELPPSAVVLISKALGDQGYRDEAIDLLRSVQKLYPDDFSVNFDLGFWCAESGPQRHHDAIAWMRAAVALRPKSYLAWNGLGHALMQVSKEAEALDCFQRSIELDNSFAGAHANVGAALMKQNDVAGAIASYRRAAAQDPRDASIVVKLGEVYREQSRFSEAIECYEKAIALAPNDVLDVAAAHLYLGHVYLEQDRLDLAEDHYRFVAELPVDQANGLAQAKALAHNGLGNVHQVRQQLEEAKLDYLQAAELDANEANPSYNLSVLLKKQGRWDEAIHYARKAIELSPDWAYPHNSLGMCLLEIGSLDEAAKSFRKAIELDVKFAISHYHLSRVLRDQGNLSGALHSIRKAIEIEPGNARFHIALGILLRSDGQAVEACRSYSSALELLPAQHQERGKCLNNLGLLRKELGDFDGAKDCLSEAVELEPENFGRLLNLARLLTTSDLDSDWKDAHTHAQKATTLEPDRWQGWHVLSIASYQQGHIEESIHARKTKVKLVDETPEDDLFLARSYWHLGKNTDSRGYFQKAHFQLGEYEAIPADVAQLFDEVKKLLNDENVTSTSETQEENRQSDNKENNGR